MSDKPMTVKNAAEMRVRIAAMSPEELADWLLVANADDPERVRRLDPRNVSDIRMIDAMIAKGHDPMDLYLKELGTATIPLDEVIENLANSEFSPFLESATSGEC